MKLRDPPARGLIFTSTLAVVLAFNLTFFIQELMLVIPKALTPGLEPTLFHNNHGWRGTHPIQELLQGSGALATLCSGALFTAWLARCAPRGFAVRMLVFWMALLGFLAALPQFVIGAIIPQNDVGRAMTALHFTPAARNFAATLAIACMALACWRLTPYLLSFGATDANRRERLATAWRAAVAPGLLAIPLIVPFRIPNAAIEVLLPPVVDLAVAAAGITAAACWCRPAPVDAPRPQSVAALLLAACALLALFQLVLRRGVDFF